MSSTTNAGQQSKPLELELTILSAKHLHNVNWRNGDIKPYVVFWLDSDRRLSTKPDQSGSTKPIWNENFNLPIASPIYEAVLSIEILHSKPSETPNPLIGSVRIDIKELKDPADGTLVRKFELRRPSGRPQGKISVKLAVSEREYAPPNHNPYYYSAGPPPPRQYPYSSPYQHPPSRSPAPAPGSYYGSYPPEPYPGYYSGYYQQPPPPPPVTVRPYLSYGGGPSAPVDYGQKQRSSGEVGAVAGAMGGLKLDEEDKYSVGGRGEVDLASRDAYTHYHHY